MKTWTVMLTDQPLLSFTVSHFTSLLFYPMQIVYILDQVRALENEMVLRLKKQGLDVTPKILIVSLFLFCFLHAQF